MALEIETMTEAFNTLCGQLLGKGMTRKVFEMRHNPCLVVKVEEDQRFRFQNVTEYLAWEAVRETDYAKWFARVRDISPDGRVLVMERTSTLSESSYPDKLPAFLTDPKFSNYGELDGRFVCHDYGSCLLMTTGLTSRMRTVHWYRE